MVHFLPVDWNIHRLLFGLNLFLRRHLCRCRFVCRQPLTRHAFVRLLIPFGSISGMLMLLNRLTGNLLHSHRNTKVSLVLTILRLCCLPCLCGSVLLFFLLFFQLFERFLLLFRSKTFFLLLCLHLIQPLSRRFQIYCLQRSLVSHSSCRLLSAFWDHTVRRFSVIRLLLHKSAVLLFHLFLVGIALAKGCHHFKPMENIYTQKNQSKQYRSGAALADQGRKTVRDSSSYNTTTAFSVLCHILQ